MKLSVDEENSFENFFKELCMENVKYVAVALSQGPRCYCQIEVDRGNIKDLEVCSSK